VSLIIVLHIFLSRNPKVRLLLRQPEIIVFRLYVANIGNAAKLPKGQKKAVNLVNIIVIRIVILTKMAIGIR
jgi:hypothetical protein